MVVCFPWVRASPNYRRIWLIYQYFSASVQFIPNFFKLKLQTSRDSKIVQNKNVFYQRFPSVCETKPPLYLSRQCFIFLFQTTKHNSFQPSSKTLTVPRGFFTVLMKTRCFLYVDREWRVCVVVSCRYNFFYKKINRTGVKWGCILVFN